MLKRAVVFLLCASLLALPGAAQRGPSTAEERARLVRVVRALESDPLSKELVKDREWAIRFLIEVPDITVKVCNLLGPVLGSKKNYASELVVQMTLSQGAFAAESPEKAKDDNAAYLAGVEGVLKAYEAILKAKPKAKWPYLDDLIEKRGRGELPAEVQKIAAANCKE